MSNRIAPEAKIALEQMKAEYAKELTIANPQVKNRGEMTSRENGYIGGYKSKNSNSDNLKNNNKLE